MTHDIDTDTDDFAPVPLHAGPVPERSPSEIERQVCVVSRRAPLEDLCAMLDAADWLLARAKSINQVAKQKAIEWIDANGPFDIGMCHYHVGHNTTVNCTNTVRCGHALLDHLHGDLDRFFGVLVAQPYKPGAARAILDQSVYNNVFTVRSTAKLVAGVPQRVLKCTDKRFMR